MRRISLIIVIVSFLSCERQDILRECFCTNSAKIPITVDWTKSDIAPKNITMMFYDDSDGRLVLEHCYEHNTDAVHSYVHLPVGEYTVVIFNELCDQIQNVTVRGSESFSTLGFYAVENPNANIRTKGGSYIAEPGCLGLKVIEKLVVTKELIAYTHGEGIMRASSDTKKRSEMLLNIVPENKTCWLNINIHIIGLSNARMPALIDMQNISEGYIVSKDENSMAPAIFQFGIGNCVYDVCSQTDGTISTRVALFGTLGDRNSVNDHTDDAPIIIDILFMLVDDDRTVVNRKIDITKLIHFNKELSGSISLNVDMAIESPLPYVKPEPEGDGGSGFSSEVKDWDVIDVPLS